MTKKTTERKSQKSDKTKQVTYKDLLIKSGMQLQLGKVKLDKLSIMSLKNIHRLQTNIKKHIEEYYELQKKLFEAYEIEEVDGTYDWTGHKLEEEIEEKLKDLRETKVTLKPVKFMPDTDFYGSLKHTDIQVLESLAEFLHKSN